MKRFEEQVALTCSKNPNQFVFVGLVVRIEVGSVRLILKQKWPVHVMGRDLSPQLVAGTSPLVSATHRVGVEVVKVSCRPLRLLNDFSASQ